MDTLARFPAVQCHQDVPLRQHTRFGIGGPARWFVDAAEEGSFVEVVRALHAAGMPFVLLGGGSNLVVADAGVAGVVLRFTGAKLSVEGERITVESGAVLQDLVNASIAAGLAGLHTMTRIPGWVGGAVYGNAGAYGHSIHEFVEQVRFFDGREIRKFDNAACEFAYRESIFKRHKDWLILAATLRLPVGDAATLAAQAADIQNIRDAKYPPSMRCAGSIFKNLLWRNLPPAVQAEVPASVVREGKVPAAWFLEQVGAKGLRFGDIQVATYHANLIYNDGDGMAADVRRAIAELKARVEARFGFVIEEEVQYVGFEAQYAGL
jgi:UDP-N-acetylmuramate dehydrogenase